MNQSQQEKKYFPLFNKQNWGQTEKKELQPGYDEDFLADPNLESEKSLKKKIVTRKNCSSGKDAEQMKKSYQVQNKPYGRGQR